MSSEYSNKKVLIVDDEPDIVEIISDILKEEFDCQTVTAENGYEALKLLESTQFDMVCTDLHMPVMDGISMIKALREGESKNKEISVLIISGYPSDSDKLIAQYDNVIILDKPINEKRLIGYTKLILKSSI